MTKRSTGHEADHEHRPQGTRTRVPKLQVRDSIVATALNLFREKGYSRTSLSEIARQMGLDPSSLYYYFPSKIAVLNDIINSAGGHVVPPVEHLSKLSQSRTEQLYALIVEDTVTKCELPFDFIELEGISHEDPAAFTTFFNRYQMFYRTLVRIIELGIAEGEFLPCEADERAVTILSVNEGLQHHYHAKHRGELILETSGYTVRNYTPEQIGRMSASSVIPSLITREVDFEQAAEGGMRLYYALLAEREDMMAERAAASSELPAAE